MKKWAKLADVVGQPLEAFGEMVGRGDKLVLVFRESFVVICVDVPSYAECMIDAGVTDEEPGNPLDAISEQMLVDLSIATRDEVAALEAERHAMRVKREAERIQKGIEAEREQYERLRRKFGG